MDLPRTTESALIAASIAQRHGEGLDVADIRLERDEAVITINAKRLTVPTEWPPSLVVQMINDEFGSALPIRHTDEPYPAEPLTVDEKWRELLRDLGESKRILTDQVVGSDYTSVTRLGGIACIGCSRGAEHWILEVPLDDGELPVGTPDELVFKYADLRSTPPAHT